MDHGNKKYNSYYYCNDYMVGIMNDGKEFYFDVDDFEKIKCHRWFIKSGYVCSKLKSRDTLSLHRLILNCDSEFEIDHINNNKRDNRKSNLRSCSHHQNTQNRSKSDNKSSKYKGVSYHKQSERWRARISNNGNHICIGYFKTQNEAAKAYNEKALFYFGEFANVNKID